MKAAQQLLKLTELSAGYSQSPVLFNINMMIEKGDIVCLLGRNGMGKTTLLRSIIGLTKIMNGDIVFDADDITKLPTYKRARYGIAFIPQGREIIPYLRSFSLWRKAQLLLMARHLTLLTL